MIKTNDAVYIMKNDISYLNSFEHDIPTAIFMQLFGNGIVNLNDSSRYEFQKFDKTHEMEFFKSLDWMVDYNFIKDLSNEEIIKIGQDINNRKNKIADEFNAMPLNERKKNRDMVTQYELLDFKFHSLRDFLWFKQGHLELTLPEGVDYPKGYVKKEETEETKTIEKTEELQGIQKLKKLFNPKKRK